MRIVVDFDRCESNGLCVDIAPDIFEIRDDDLLYVLVDEPGEDRRSVIDDAITRCPKQAIRIEYASAG